ncbi:Beta-1,3-galactosyltransferase 2 [Halotydeus destructor]|nr:Beta-1,3-galactosyltransferase 2 [Halotydeus destructor]
MVMVVRYGVMVDQSAQKFSSETFPAKGHPSMNVEKVFRKISFTKDEIETTESFAIDKPSFCGPDKGSAMDLMVVVTSAVTHFQARQAIRDTWGALAVTNGSRLLFLLGSTVNETVQHHAAREEFQYKDVLQGHFIDHYSNLTLKTISLMRWITSTCHRVKFGLKVDDDMFVNMEKLLDYSKTHTFNKTIIGNLAHKWKPIRSRANKWYLPESAFGGAIYPDFTAGPAYLFTGDAAKPLLETSLSLTPIYLEDVYMTGIVAEKAQVRRINHDLITNYHLDVDACTFDTFITSHQHTPQDIVQLWKAVHEQPVTPCFEYDTEYYTESGEYYDDETMDSDLDCYPVAKTICGLDPVLGKTCMNVKQYGQQCQVTEQCSKTNSEFDCLLKLELNEYQCQCRNFDMEFHAETNTCRISLRNIDTDCNSSVPHCNGQLFVAHDNFSATMQSWVSVHIGALSTGELIAAVGVGVFAIAVLFAICRSCFKCGSRKTAEPAPILNNAHLRTAVQPEDTPPSYANVAHQFDGRTRPHVHHGFSYAPELTLNSDRSVAYAPSPSAPKM